MSREPILMTSWIILSKGFNFILYFMHAVSTVRINIDSGRRGHQCGPRKVDCGREAGIKE